MSSSTLALRGPDENPVTTQVAGRHLADQGPERAPPPGRSADASRPSSLDGGAPQGVELRHLRYFVAVADAGTFTHAAERMFIAQPTLSQQIRRLEEMVGAPLLQRCREGVRLTAAGTVLLEESRTVLSLIDHGVSRTRQAAGVGRPRLRFVVPPYLPEALTVEAASRLRSTAAAAGVDVTWMETALDAEFSAIRQRRADAGLGWLRPEDEGWPAPLDMMRLGDFEPDVWVPAAHRAARAGVIGLDELAGLDVVHGPRRTGAAVYDNWLAVLRATSPRFAFTDPPFRHSLPMTLAFAATGSRPTAVLTSPRHRLGAGHGQARPACTHDMVCVRVEHHRLAATAGLVWNGDLPRPLQQVLFDAADSAGF
jgi:LysR family transcriptional regulator, benzoate and cis,cis-muconate-responsive activator of ben and cat genes